MKKRTKIILAVLLAAAIGAFVFAAIYEIKGEMTVMLDSTGKEMGFVMSQNLLGQMKMYYYFDGELTTIYYYNADGTVTAVDQQTGETELLPKAEPVQK